MKLPPMDLTAANLLYISLALTAGIVIGAILG